MGDGAAYGISEYTALALGEGVREIGDFAFAENAMLETIEVAPTHDGDLTVSATAFDGCPRLFRISCPATVADDFRTACPGVEIRIIG